MSVYSAGTLAGKGAGSLTQTAWNYGRLDSQLTDNKSNGYRTFVDAYGYATIGTQKYDTKAQSGRRTDGQNAWGTMAPKSMYGPYIAAYTFKVQVCEDHPSTPDFCSSVKTGKIG